MENTRIIRKIGDNKLYYGVRLERGEMTDIASIDGVEYSNNLDVIADTWFIRTKDKIDVTNMRVNRYRLTKELLAKINRGKRISVYDIKDTNNIEKGLRISKPISRVRYNNDLDCWDGSNFKGSGCGVGINKGITKMMDGRYVILYSSLFKGNKDYGLVVTEEDALLEIINSNNLHLLDRVKYRELRELYDFSIR